MKKYMGPILKPGERCEICESILGTRRADSRGYATPAAAYYDGLHVCPKGSKPAEKRH